MGLGSARVSRKMGGIRATTIRLVDDWGLSACVLSMTCADVGTVGTINRREDAGVIIFGAGSSGPGAGGERGMARNAGQPWLPGKGEERPTWR